MTKIKLVLIDDDAEFLEEAKLMLNKTDYEAVCLTDNEYEIGKLRSIRPDVILLDIKMRIRSGLQIAFEIKRDAMLKNIPIIAMSSVYIENDVLALCGIKERLMKPFFPADVIKSVENVLAVNE
jgi:DNA-binding response OmpR family regulator